MAKQTEQHKSEGSQYCDKVTGWTTRVRFSAGAGNFSRHHRYVQTSPRAHPASYLMGTGCSYLAGKAVGTWSWPLTSICEVKYAWIYTSIPPYVFMVWCWIKQRDKVNFRLLNAIIKYWIFFSGKRTCADDVLNLEGPPLDKRQTDKETTTPGPLMDSVKQVKHCDPLQCVSPVERHVDRYNRIWTTGGNR